MYKVVVLLGEKTVYTSADCSMQTREWVICNEQEAGMEQN